MSKTRIPAGGIGADAIDATKIADDAISEEHLDPTAITASTEKSTLVAADKFLIADSAASNAIKYVQQSNLGSAMVASSGNAANYMFYIYNNPNSTNMGNNLHGHNWGYRSDLGDYLYTEFTCGFNNSHNVTGFRVHAQGNDNSTFDYAIYGIAK